MVSGGQLRPPARPGRERGLFQGGWWGGRNAVGGRGGATPVWRRERPAGVPRGRKASRAVVLPHPADVGQPIAVFAIGVSRRGLLAFKRCIAILAFSR